MNNQNQGQQPAQQQPQGQGQQVTFYLNPASAMTGLLDFSDVESRKYFHKAIKKLDEDELFDCQPENMHHFLKMFHQRANEHGWDSDITGVLWIPEDHTDPNSALRYLPTEYGKITMEQITKFEKSYLGGNKRSAQDSYMVYKCLLNSLSKEAKIKIEAWENEYIVTNDAGTKIPSGNLLLKVIIRESHLDTNATTQSIRTKLSNLDQYIVTIGCDITKFNGHVKMLVNSLAARGQRTEDLLANLFKGYLAASDKVFVKYITDKMEKYEEGADIKSDNLMQLADNKYRLLKERNQWDAPSEEEEKILALQAEVNKLKEAKIKREKKRQSNKDKKRRGKNGGKSKNPNNSKQQEKPAWMHQRPEDSDLTKPRQWNGKDWWYCHPDTGGKCDGEYRRHKPEECEGKSYRKRVGAKAASKTNNNGQNKKLKVAEALTSVVEDDNTESDSSGYES